MRPLLKRSAPILILLLAMVLFYWKLVLTGQYTWMESPDLVYMDLPRFQFQAAEWRAGRFPVWDPFSWGGQPFLAQVVGAANPLIWLVAWAPLKNGFISETVLNYWFVLVHLLGAWFAYLFCRKLGCSRWAALLGGFAFTTLGFAGAVDWPQVLTGSLIAPLVFLYQWMAAEERRPWSSAALSGVFLGLGWLSGHHEVPIYVSTVWGFSWLYFAYSSKQWRTLLYAAVSGLFTGLVGALQILPTYEYGKLALRWVGVERPVGWSDPIPYMVHEQYSMPAFSALGVLFPGLNRHANPFVGLVCFSLALIAVWLLWERRVVRWLAGMALAGFFLAIGVNNPFHGMLYAVLPLFGKARVPARAIVVLGLAAAPLAAMGFDVLRTQAQHPLIKRMAAALLLAGGTIFAVAFGSAVLNKYDPSDRMMLSALLAVLLAAVYWSFSAGTVPTKTALVMITMLAYFEAGHGTAIYFHNRRNTQQQSYLEGLYGLRDVVGFFKSQPGIFRGDVDSRDIPSNFGQYYRVEMTSSFGASFTENMVKLEYHTPRVQDLMGVKFAIGKEPKRPEQKEVFTSSSGLKVFANADAFPRAWTVHEIETVKDRNLLRARLQDPKVDLRKHGLTWADVSGVTGCDGSGDRADVVANRPDEVRIKVHMNCSGVAVLSDTYYPGWQATVDGTRATIYEMYGAIRGVSVAAGDHELVYRYRPVSVYAGAAMTFIGVLGALGLLILRH